MNTASRDVADDVPERAPKPAARKMSRGPRSAILGTAIAVVAIAAFAIGGGLRAAVPTPSDAAYGVEVDTTLYSATVIDAEAVAEAEEQYWEAEPGEILVLVTVRIENRASYPVMVLGAVDSAASRLVQGDEPLLRLAGVEPVDSPRVWRADGSPRGPILQPGVPADVVIGWPVDQEQLADAGAVLEVYDASEEFGRFVVSSSAATWKATDIAARVELEVSR